jgi:hypothetical protein
MKLYHYKKNNGEYAGTTDAKLDPLESKRLGRDVYLIPAFATKEKPAPTLDRQVPVFQDGKWIVKSDYRGVTVYNTATREGRKITQIDDEPGSNETEIQPPPEPYYNWSGSEWSEDATAKQEYFELQSENEKLRKINVAFYKLINQAIENRWSWADFLIEVQKKRDGV